MTKSTDYAEDVQRFSCEYAQPDSTTDGATWLEPYVSQNRFCGVNFELYQSGMGCGDCYVLEYSGQGGTNPGRPGSATVQVVDSGGGAEFNCFLDVFTEITGSDTGEFPITYSKVPCDVTGPRVPK